MSYIDEHIEYLGVHEGTKGASERVEDSSKSAAPYGLDNPPIPRKEKETDKAYAKRVLQYFEKEAINTLGDAYSNAPIGVKRAVLDSYYNSGRLYPGQVASLKGSDYKGFAKNTLDIVSANDPKTNSGGILKGLANRKAATYNLMAGDETGLPPITGGELINVDGNAKLIYNTGKDPYTFDFQKPLHSGSTPGALNVKTVQPQEVVKQIPAGGIQQLEQQMFKPYNFGFRKGGRVIKTKPIEVSARSLFDIQENARRSMMQGNYQDRMDDYDYAREQAQRPYVNRYPVDSRGQGAYSTAAPMRNQAARMMGFAKGGLINTQGPRPMNNLKTQAQGLAALGRGGDSTLVHMQPEEVAGLQQLAQANGTSLTINPATGMPEAFNLGGMFRAALPIAAGFFAPPSLLPGLGATGSAMLAGGATGSALAAMSGEDPIMGGVSGAFGGSSGAGLKGAFSGVGDAIGTMPNTGNSMMTSPQLAAGPDIAGAMASDPMAALGRGASQLNTNLGNITATPATRAPVAGEAAGSRILTGEMEPGGFFQKANRIGGPAASLALGGLEESDFYEDVEFNDPRDKYNPNSKLNLNRDTGIAAALSRDTGLRLYAEGGEVGGGVTGAGLAPGTPVASIGGGVTGRGLAPGTPVAGAMAGAKPHAAPGMESFDSMVASGVHPANAAAMHGMDPRPFLDLPTAPAAGYARKPEVMESPYGASTRSRKAYGGRPRRYATGGYLNTGGEIGDGMSDDIQATINNNQPAALSDGEFVVPADVVSHLGNGSSDAGAKRLYDMMDKVRKARTGTKKQGREINPEKMMPK